MPERPVILNGIEDIIERPDLADRTLFLTLEPIPENRRRLEKELWSDFEEARPSNLKRRIAGCGGQRSAGASRCEVGTPSAHGRFCPLGHGL